MKALFLVIMGIDAGVEYRVITLMRNNHQSDTDPRHRRDPRCRCPRIARRPAIVADRAEGLSPTPTWGVAGDLSPTTWSRRSWRFSTVRHRPARGRERLPTSSPRSSPSKPRPAPCSPTWSELGYRRTMPRSSTPLGRCRVTEVERRLTIYDPPDADRRRPADPPGTRDGRRQLFRGRPHRPLGAPVAACGDSAEGGGPGRVRPPADGLAGPRGQRRRVPTAT